MSLPSKGSRTLELGGQRYRWLVRRNSTYMQAACSSPMHVAIERIGAASGTVLLVSLRVSRPDNWISPHQKTALTPAVVREIIAAALIQGWTPDAPGSAFEFEHPVIGNLLE